MKRKKKTLPLPPHLSTRRSISDSHVTSTGTLEGSTKELPRRKTMGLV